MRVLTDESYYRARYYDPQPGRFMSEDPIRIRVGVNFYRYAKNNPVHFIDLFGLGPAGAGIGAGVGGVLGGIIGGIVGAGGGAAGGTLVAPGVGTIGGGVQGGIQGAAAGAALGALIGGIIGNAIENALSRPIPPTSCPKENIDCIKAKAACIESCSDSSLPSGDHGFRFWNCLNRCMEAAGCQ